MKSKEPKETVQLALLDSVLYGAVRAFEYLGQRGQVMLDWIGEGILDYCLNEGYLEPSHNSQDLIAGLRAFFERNGYLRGRDIIKEGETVTEAIRGYQYLGLKKKLQNKGCYLLACPWCVAEDAVTRAHGVAAQDLRKISEEILPDGSYVRKYKIVRGPEPQPELPSSRIFDLSPIETKWDPSARVGLPVFEAVVYGLARGFDYLGTQAQLLLDSVGRGVIEFLRDECQMDLSGDYVKSLDTISSYCVILGLADKIETRASSNDVRVSFVNYRYASVLKRLLDEGIRLVSCPFTVATRTTLRKAGFAVGNMDWKLEGRRNVTLGMPLLSVADQQFDEDRIASLMDSE